MKDDGLYTMQSQSYFYISVRRRLIDVHGSGEEGGIAENIEHILAGWHEDGLALTDADAIDVGLAPETYHDDERVAVEINLLGYLDDDTMDDEVGTVDELAGRLRRVVRRAVLGPHLIVDGLFGLFDVQLTGIAVGILATEVIDAVGDVAGLLNLSEEVACANGMQTTGRQEIEVALVSLVGGDDVLHGRVAVDGLGSSQLLVLLGGDALLQSGIDFRAHIALDDIPHLGLAGAAVTLHGQLVVGMHLYAKVLARVDELDEQGELIAELLIDFVADQQAFVRVDQLGQREAFIDVINQSAVDGLALMAWHTADFPALADIGLCRIDAFEWCNLVTAPDGGFQIGFELVWFHSLFNY